MSSKVSRHGIGNLSKAEVIQEKEKPKQRVKRIEDFELQDLVERFIRKDSILGIEALSKKPEQVKFTKAQMDKYKRKNDSKHGFEYKRSGK